MSDFDLFCNEKKLSKLAKSLFRAYLEAIEVKADNYPAMAIAGAFPPFCGTVIQVADELRQK